MRMNRNLLSAGLLVALIGLATLGLEVRARSPMDDRLQQLYDEVQRQEWSQAATMAKTVEKEWKSRKFWIALNNSTQDQEDFERALTMARSYIGSHDKANAAAQLSLLKQNWREFGG